MSTSLHPQNDRVGDGGIGEAIMEYLNYYQRPYLIVTEDGEEKHRTPLCPAVRGQVHRLICYEEALYVYGERWCETCRMYRPGGEDTGWTDPRFRRDDTAE